MSESKPQWKTGQWRVCELDRRAVVESGTGLVVADVRDWTNPDNAHLIAAAPDLYAELERLLDVTGAPLTDTGFAALTKARGLVP